MVKLKDCSVDDTVFINGDKAIIKHKDLGTVTVRFEGNSHLSKWYDTKEVEVCENLNTSQK
jgi:hypothetical protein